MLQVRIKISNVLDPVHKSLLEHRYIYGQEWPWIAQQLHYSVYHVRRDLHDAALQALAW